MTGHTSLFLAHLRCVTVPLGYLTNAASLKGCLQTGQLLCNGQEREGGEEGARGKGNQCAALTTVGGWGGGCSTYVASLMRTGPPCSCRRCDLTCEAGEAVEKSAPLEINIYSMVPSLV